MADYALLDQAGAVEYTRRLQTHLDPQAQPWTAREIGDGNINYVHRVSDATGASIILKQADQLLRSSGRPLAQDRLRIEAEWLRRQGQLVPGCVPRVISYDAASSVLAMEDLGELRPLRHELVAGRVPDRLAPRLADLLCATLVPRSDVAVDASEQREGIATFTNPEMCAISETLVLTEPFDDHRGRNQPSAENIGFVTQHLYRDEALHADVAALREGFTSHPQTLLHGDLHTGSVFADASRLVVLDSEFATYGPAGYDIGTVLGNLVLAWTHLALAGDDASTTSQAYAVEACLADLAGALLAQFPAAWDEHVSLPLYRTAGQRRRWLVGVREDSLGYAGAEVIRRAIGDSRCREVESVQAGPQRAALERALVRQGVALIRARRELTTPQELVEVLRAARQVSS